MVIAPPALLPGDCVAIVAPAGNLSDSNKLHEACAIIRKMGFVLCKSKEKWPGEGFLADSDNNRLEEFHQAWTDPEIKGIVALRGGYGTLRLLDLLDRQIIKDNPKLLLGFSDITILLNHISQETGLICMHGPVASSLSSSDRETIDRLYQCFRGNWRTALTEKIKIIRGGNNAYGKLVGGNLSSLVTMLGTRWEINLQDKILLLEDVNEPLYKLDRLLTQLALASKVGRVSGIILGDFSNDTSESPDQKRRTHEFVWTRLAELVPDSSIPIWGNFPSGHCCKNITLPLGAFCTMDNMTGTLMFDEPDMTIDEFHR